MIVMKGKISHKVKRRLFFQTIFLFILIFALIFSVFSDWTKILQNKKKIVNLNSQYTSLLEDEESLNSEITKLQDPDYVARYAREKYMYSLPDEVIIRIPE
jgi:cell division protein DivIC